MSIALNRYFQSIVMHQKATVDLFRYLKHHESDIANEVNDFGNLSNVFFVAFGIHASGGGEEDTP